MHVQKQFSTNEITLSLPPKTTHVRMEQVHSATVTNLDEKPLQDSQEILLPQTDACFTSQPSTTLIVRTADCLPILLSAYTTDEAGSTRFVAAAHAGRKGTQQNILYKLLEELAVSYSFSEILAKPASKLSVWFGPAICVDCYQIERETDTHFDLIAENKKQLLRFCTDHQIDFKNKVKLEIDSRCTLHSKQQLHSYRRTGPGVQMNYSAISLLK